MQMKLQFAFDPHIIAVDKQESTQKSQPLHTASWNAYTAYILPVKSF